MGGQGRLEGPILKLFSQTGNKGKGRKTHPGDCPRATDPLNN